MNTRLFFRYCRELATSGWRAQKNSEGVIYVQRMRKQLVFHSGFFAPILVPNDAVLWRPAPAVAFQVCGAPVAPDNDSEAGAVLSLPECFVRLISAASSRGIGDLTGDERDVRSELLEAFSLPFDSSVN